MTQEASSAFDANAFPLGKGVRLLEASAGTGKTFALAHLVLRLVAEGHPLRELLVVTYTEAAAAELKDRIGRRLQEGLAGLEAATDGLATWAPPDRVLAAWLAAIRAMASAAEEIGILRGRLLLALEDLDAADITTIHGFCNRTLQRDALAAGCPPQLRLEKDATTQVEQVVHEYWQRQVLPLPPPLVAGLRDHCHVKPELLVQLLVNLDGDPALQLDPLPLEVPLEGSLPALLPVFWRQLWSRFQAAWRAHGRALDHDLRAAAAHWRSLGHGSTPPYSPKPRTDHCGAIDAWLAAAAEREPEACDYAALRRQKSLCSYFHPGPFSQVARKVEGDEQPIRLPQPALMEAVAALVDGPAELVLLHACRWGRHELSRRRKQSGSVGYGQLLEGLDPGEGAGEPTPLLRVVGERYRVVLVDEFQDTDPIQWRILRVAFAAGDHLLVMVGDPKQAIYRFRGGDLDTYRLARQQASERFDLVENRRSTKELIRVLNGLIPSLPRSGLPAPALAAKADRSGPAGPAVELIWLGGERQAGGVLPSKSDLERRLPALMAAHTAHLLREAPILRQGECHRRLEPDDIGLLVANHRQAEALRAALARAGIASRLVSRADVFASPAATALQRFLDALADPADANRLRLLAASPLIGWSGAAIAATSAPHWSDLAGTLDDLARQLGRLGLLGVLAQLIESETMARLSAGGRLLADLQQVSELLQIRMHEEGLGPAAAADALRWLRHGRDRDAREVPEDHQARSDRADGAVSVVTVHRSKGLEYPVVICPYLWQAPQAKGRGGSRPGVRWQPATGLGPRLNLHLDHRWGVGQQAARQQLAAEWAERERLAYVAATRAQHRLVLAWGPAAEHQCNPLFPWLFPDQPLPTPGHDPIRPLGDAAWRALLAEEIARRDLPMALIDPLPVEPPEPRSPAMPVHSWELRTGPVPQRRLDTSWGRSSYTSWTRASHGAMAPAALDEGRDTADPSPSEPTASLQASPAKAYPAISAATEWPEQGPLADFPRGPAAGECLHRILEQLDYRSSLAETANRQVVQRELRRAGLSQQPLEPLLEGLDLARLTPFGGPLGSACVADLGRERRLNEMNFDLTLGYVRAADLAEAFAAHPGGSITEEYAERLAVLPVASSGFLTGSIDLVFTAFGEDGQERWWVADWKSNWLGRRDGEGRPLACGPAHYDQLSMATLMAQNHYPLQAHLYLVALHRYLGWRLPGYEPKRHLGGYIYVFLRGTPGSEALRALPGEVPGMVVERPPLGRLLALDAALGGRP